MVWEVEYTDEFGGWWEGLTAAQQEELVARVELLEQHGPALGRPVVDQVHRSRHPNMKELRAQADGAHLRVLFCFDPRRTAILLLGGDKAEDSQWNAWYAAAIPRADDLYGDHLGELREEGVL